MDKEKFFDDTFKMLLALTAGVWIVYVVFLLFAGDGKVCEAASSELILNVLALSAGILTAPPLVYGLVRLLFWPEGPKGQTIWIAAWFVSCGVAVFVTASILFSLAISQYGCR